ncbi:hypothetical protein ACFXGA_31405 [Actinosynnema sp. NPDC059335]|uniref:hypothetical protein n=1 Tax=Actinosynnema sp. NPDC059335 TaxID=3346804 RepID=UPI00366E0006
MDLSPLAFDVRQLLLELGAGPVGVAEQVEQPVLSRVQLVQAGTESLLEVAHDGLLSEEGLVELATDGGLEAAAEAHGAEVPVDGGLDVLELLAAQRPPRGSRGLLGREDMDFSIF